MRTPVNKRLLINSTVSETRIGLVERERLAELYVEATTSAVWLATSTRPRSVESSPACSRRS